MSAKRESGIGLWRFLSFLAPAAAAQTGSFFVRERLASKPDTTYSRAVSITARLYVPIRKRKSEGTLLGDRPVGADKWCGLAIGSENQRRSSIGLYKQRLFLKFIEKHNFVNLTT